MARGSKEDLEILISNLRNLNVDLIYILLLVKSMRYNHELYRIRREHRAAILAEFQDDLESEQEIELEDESQDEELVTEDVKPDDDENDVTNPENYIKVNVSE